MSSFVNARARQVVFWPSVGKRRVIAIADRAFSQSMPWSMVRRITLTGPKSQRKLIAQWFAKRVDLRCRGCLRRSPNTAAGEQHADPRESRPWIQIARTLERG